jgi:molybdopterin converting factor small subunit
MEFRDFAAKEAADFADRLTKAAAAAAELAAKKAADERTRAVEGVRAEAQATLKKASDEAQKAADALRAELQATVKQKMSLAASVKETQAQLEAVRGDLKTATERGEIASRQLGEARKTNEKLEITRDELTLARDEQGRARATAEGELRKTREMLDTVRGQLTTAAKTIEKGVVERTALEESASIAHSQSEAAEAKLSAVTDLFKQSAARVKVLERAQQDHERALRDLESRQKAPATTAAVASSLPILDDLLAGFQALQSAATVGDVLTTLVEQLAAQFPRVALFRVKKSHLQGEHQIGFDLKTDIAKVVLPLGMDSLLARAVNSGQIERLAGDELKDGTRAPFSGSPRFALAVPIAAAGETLAIVYADDAGAGKDRRAADASLTGARFAEAMQHHAVALLMRLTNELKARAELQTYAQSLVRELEQMYASDQQSEKSADELQARLKGNLEYARSIFESRVALEGSDAAALLDDEITALIDTAQGTPFAGHLAAVAGRPVTSRNAAEAS